MDKPDASEIAHWFSREDYCKIDAIKMFRERTGCSLKQAKDALEAVPATPPPDWHRDPAVLAIMKLHVRDLKSRAIVHSIDMGDRCSERELERVMLGLLTNMDRESFYVDDSEVVTNERKAREVTP